eukprot:3938832-Rhodomonas_salina.3
MRVTFTRGQELPTERFESTHAWAPAVLHSLRCRVLTNRDVECLDTYRKTKQTNEFQTAVQPIVQNPRASGKRGFRTVEVHGEAGRLAFEVCLAARLPAAIVTPRCWHSRSQRVT